MKKLFFFPILLLASPVFAQQATWSIAHRGQAIQVHTVNPPRIVSSLPHTLTPAAAAPIPAVSKAAVSAQSHQLLWDMRNAERHTQAWVPRTGGLFELELPLPAAVAEVTAAAPGVSPVTVSFVALYPNPAQKHVTLTIYKEAAVLRIWDTQGREVHHASYANGQHTLNIGTLTPGIYYWQAQASGQSLETGKLLIQ